MGKNTITPVERPTRFGERQYLTDEEQTLLERRVSEIAEEDGDALFGDGVFEAALSGVVNSYDPSTGNYDQAWLVERSVHNRTSQIVNPINGQYPPLAGDADGITFNRPQTGNTNPESWLGLTPEPIFEYACHEGNYSMANILRGAREQERMNTD